MRKRSQETVPGEREVEPTDQVLDDAELDHVFGGMTGTYVCASAQQDVVMS